MRKIALVCLIIPALIYLQSCSVIMAGKKQVRKDITCIRVGEHRDIIVQTIGGPDTSVRLDKGGYKDVYKIVENAGTAGSKTFAVAGHATMDVLTLGLWEIIGTPLELATEEEATRFILYYDPNNILTSYEAIK